MTRSVTHHIQVVVPKFYEFIPAILNYLADGRERSNKGNLCRRCQTFRALS